MFIDTHCHIEKKYYDNIDLLIKENTLAGCKYMITSCCEEETLKDCDYLTNKYNEVYATIGFHPEEVDRLPNNYLDIIKVHIKRNKKIIGIGEIGLDYHYTKDNKIEQIKLFEEQLKLAEEYNLPVVIHSRDATEDTINTLKKYNVKGVIHCFSGSFETASIYIKMGFKLGIGGTVTFKNSNLPLTLSKIDIHNLVLETDSPYLAPHPLRGSVNKSANINYVIEKLASIYNIDINEVSKITFNNTLDIYNFNK